MRRMWMAGALLVCCSLSLGWAVAQEPERKGEAAQSDEARLQGTWVGREAGEPVFRQPMMIVRGTQYEFKLPGNEIEFKGVLTLNPAANPKQVDILIKESSDPDQKYIGKSALAIYKIDEDGTLTLALSEPGVAARPGKLEPSEEGKVFVFKKWEPGMILPGNPPELKVLEKRIGTWATETVVKPGPWNTTGQKITGTETTEWILGGRFQQARNANRPANPDGLFLSTYDTQLKAFRGWYHDDQGNSSEWTGQWDEAAQTLNWTSEAKNQQECPKEDRRDNPLGEPDLEGRGSQEGDDQRSKGTRCDPHHEILLSLAAEPVGQLSSQGRLEKRVILGHFSATSSARVSWSSPASLCRPGS